MSKETDNVALLKEAYRNWHDSKGASIEHWLNLLTDDILFRSLAAGAAPMQFTRTASVKGQVRQYFARMLSEWEMIYFRIDEYIAQNDRVVALGEVSFRHKRSGKVVVSPKADIHRFRDDKICEYFEFYDTAAAFAAATV